jgi:hypothetical protein
MHVAMMVAVQGAMAVIYLSQIFLARGTEDQYLSGISLDLNLIGADLYLMPAGA